MPYYNWYHNGTFVESTGYPYVFQITTPFDIASVEVQTVDACGSSGYTYQNRPAFGANNSLATNDSVENKGSLSCTISPNPASNTINIAVNGATNMVKRIAPNEVLLGESKGGSFDAIIIYNNSGSIVKRETYQQVPLADINVADLPNGTYFIEIVSGTNKQTQKLVIQR